MKRKKPSKRMRQLLQELEWQIGSECYNGNIQNYGPWGQWEGEGREFRYPVTYPDGEGDLRKYRSDQPYGMKGPLKPDQLNQAYYAFGANRLHIFRGIMNAVELLKQVFGIDFESMLKAKAAS